jgi:hypothetical protein
VHSEIAFQDFLSKFHEVSIAEIRQAIRFGTMVPFIPENRPGDAMCNRLVIAGMISFSELGITHVAGSVLDHPNLFCRNARAGGSGKQENRQLNFRISKAGNCVRVGWKVDLHSERFILNRRSVEHDWHSNFATGHSGVLFNAGEE